MPYVNAKPRRIFRTMMPADSVRSALVDQDGRRRTQREISPPRDRFLVSTFYMRHLTTDRLLRLAIRRPRPIIIQSPRQEAALRGLDERMMSSSSRAGERMAAAGPFASRRSGVHGRDAGSGGTGYGTSQVVKALRSVTLRAREPPSAIASRNRRQAPPFRTSTRTLLEPSRRLRQPADLDSRVPALMRRRRPVGRRM